MEQRPGRFTVLSTTIENLKIDFILQDGFFSTEDFWQAKSHFHSCYELHLILDGRAAFYTDTRTIFLKKNDICLVPPYCNHGIRRTLAPIKKASLLMEFHCIKADGAQDAYAFYTDLYAQYYDIHIVEQAGLYEKYIPAIIRGFEDTSQIRTHHLQALFNLLFLEITELLLAQKPARLPDAPPDPDPSRNLENARGVRAIYFLDQNYMRDISLRDIADHLGLSERQSARVLREITGYSFSELLLNRRMTAARELIESSNVPITQIASQIGYKSYNGFYNAFVRFFGFPPSALS